MRWVYNIILFGLLKGSQSSPSQVGIALFCQTTHARFQLKVCLSRIWRNVFQTFDLSSIFNTFQGDRLLSRSCHLWTLSSSCGTIVGWGALVHNFPSFLLNYKEVFFYWPILFSGRGPQRRGVVQSVPGEVKNLRLDWTHQLTGTQGPLKPWTVECQKSWKRGRAGSIWGNLFSAHVRTDWKAISWVGPMIPLHWREENSVRAHIEIKC